MNRNLLVVSVLALAAFLSGCPEEGVVCTEGLTVCGQTCEDLQSDGRNCGGCGVSCLSGQVCQAGGCVCAPGAVSCGDGCVVLSSNPKHCGACGNACAEKQFCDQGACAASCTSPGAIACGQSCVDPNTDPDHCGGCGVACENAQTCHAGRCSWDLVAACITNGQVVGLRDGTDLKSPARDLGSAPQSLAAWQSEFLLSLDGTDQRLYQAQLSDFSSIEPAARTGAIPNHVLAEPPFVYVVNSGANTLQILEEGAADAGSSSASLGLGTVAEVPFGENAFPQVAAKVGSKLYVTLYGGTTSATIGAGQRVVEVDIADPRNPVKGREFDLASLPLESFTDGGTPVPRPQGIAYRGGALYVALNNLDPFYAVAGPAYLAELPLDGGTMGLIRLPEESCLNAGWVAARSGQLVVSCAGRSDYSQFPIVRTAESGLALVSSSGAVTSALEIGCPEPADGGCKDPSLARFAIRGDLIYAGDQSAGRIFVVQISGEQLVPVRTYSAAAPPLQVCAVDPQFGYSQVADVLSLP